MLFETVADLGFFSMLYLSFRTWDPHETYGQWYWIQILSFDEKIFVIGVCEKKSFFKSPPLRFFWLLLVFRFLEFCHNLHRISSRDFKFHRKICIRSRVITFWIFVPFFGTSRKNSKRYNSWADAYFSMKFEISRWNSM